MKRDPTTTAEEEEVLPVVLVELVELVELVALPVVVVVEVEVVVQKILTEAVVPTALQELLLTTVMFWSPVAGQEVELNKLMEADPLTLRAPVTP